MKGKYHIPELIPYINETHKEVFCNWNRNSQESNITASVVSHERSVRTI